MRDRQTVGGSLSHEFMLLTPVGEDSIVLCDECDFRANKIRMILMWSYLSGGILKLTRQNWSTI